MAMVELTEKVRIKDLEEGRIFDQDELIIERYDDVMTTLRRDPLGDIIRRYHYDLHKTKSEIVINNNGYGDFDSTDREYKEYDKKLREEGL